MNVTELIAFHAEAALEPHVLPSPARSAEVAAVVAPLRRVAQRRFDASPVWARGLVMAA
jgi:hypothetical protein